MVSVPTEGIGLPSSQSRKVVSGSVCVNTCVPWGSLTGWPLDPGSPWFPGSPVPPSVPRLPGGPSCPGNPLSPLKKYTKMTNQREINGSRRGEALNNHSTGSVNISGCWGNRHRPGGGGGVLKTSASLRGKSLFLLWHSGATFRPLSHTPLLFIVSSQQTMQSPPPHFHSRWPSLLI